MPEATELRFWFGYIQYVYFDSTIAGFSHLNIKYTGSRSESVALLLTGNQNGLVHDEIEH